VHDPERLHVAVQQLHLAFAGDVLAPAVHAAGPRDDGNQGHGGTHTHGCAEERALRREAALGPAPPALRRSHVRLRRTCVHGARDHALGLHARSSARPARLPAISIELRPIFIFG